MELFNSVSVELIMKIRRWEKMIFIYCFFGFVCILFSTVSASFSNAQIKAPLDFSLQGLPAKGGLPIGINLDNVNYYSPSLIFNDAMKSASNVVSIYNYTNSGVVDQIPSDSYGWPLQLPYTVNGNSQTGRLYLNCNYSGEYVVLYDGEGTLTVGGVSSKVVDGRIHITFPGLASEVNIWIDIVKSMAGNHIRNMRIIPIEYLSKEASMPTFRQDYLEGLRPFHSLRFMKSTETETSNVSDWSERTVKNSLTQGNGKGIAWEYVIELSNQLNIDPWISIPYKASDDYIIQLAYLFKNNLNPSRKLYLEYANELWNWMYVSSSYILNNAPGHPNSYVSSDLEAIGAAGVNHPEKDAYMMARTFRIFAQVFDDEIESRVVRVATGQSTWADNSRRILKYLFETNGIGADALAVGGYFYFNPSDHTTWNGMEPANVTPEMILQSASDYYSTGTGAAITQTAQYANQYGVDYLVYEGGQHMQPHNQQVWDYNHAVYDAQIHPVMYSLYQKNFNAHQAAGCKLFVAFSYVGPRISQYGSWGHLENLGQLDSPSTLMITAPKYQALLDWAKSSRRLFRNVRVGEVEL